MKILNMRRVNKIVGYINYFKGVMLEMYTCAFITDWSLSGNHIFSFIGVIVYIAIIAFKWYCER